MGQIATSAEIMQQAARQPAASQATTIEQSRAVAEVQAAIVLAQRCPRDETRALSRAIEACKTREVAEMAFFKLPRGGSTVQGETIHLAVELARCWGNINYGVMELNRDEAAGMSEMLAYAWDLETNARNSMAFLVPHVRDTKSGQKRLVDVRDIYENNANMGARRLRECIFRSLPSYLKEQAKAACYKTLETKASEKPIAVAIAEAVNAFAGIGISRERLEGKVGPLDKLTPADLANLEVSFRSIKRNEISAEEEFPKVGHFEAERQIREQIAAKPEASAAEDEVPADHPGHKIVEIIVKACRDAKTAKQIADIRGSRAQDIEALPDSLKTKALAAIEFSLASMTVTEKMEGK